MPLWWGMTRTTLLITPARPYNASPTVNVLDSAVITHVTVYNSSAVNFAGVANDIVALDNSTINLNGGIVGVTTAWENSTFNISDGKFDLFETQRSLGLLGTPTVNVSGGTIRSLGITGTAIEFDTPLPVDNVVNISGGTVSYLSAIGSTSKIFVSGGVIDGYLDLRDRSTVSISGGQINGLIELNQFVAGPNALPYSENTVNLYGSSLRLLNPVPFSQSGVSGTHYNLFGTLLDGSELDGVSVRVVQGGIVNLFGGASQGDPLLPTTTKGDVFTFTDAPSGAWFDPPTTGSFTYAMTGGDAFTGIKGFPTGFSSAFTVTVNGARLGTFSSGQSLNFADFGFAGGVSSFTLSGITPEVETGNPTGFPLQLTFSKGFSSFTMQGTAAAPEPGSVALFAVGLALGASALRRRR